MELFLVSLVYETIRGVGFKKKIFGPLRKNKTPKNITRFKSGLPWAWAFFPPVMFANHPQLIAFLQEQLKFVYDTLEEFVLCGHTYFPAKEISQRLKAKSVRPPGSKHNEYERQYAVRRYVTSFRVTFSLFRSSISFFNFFLQIILLNFVMGSIFYFRCRYLKVLLGNNT